MGPWRPPAAGSVSYWPDDRKHVFPYGFDPLELKGRDLRREKQNAAPRRWLARAPSQATPATIGPASTQESHLRNI
jgi:hypothetical protein